MVSFSSQQEIDDYLSGDRIQCLICGKSYLSLSSHLVRAHDISPFDYKDRLGISKGTPLVTSFISEKMSTSAIESDTIKTIRNLDEEYKKNYRMVGSKTKKKRTKIHIQKLMPNLSYSDNRGEKHGNAVLTDEQAKEIFLSTDKQKVLAKRYGVFQSNISLIWRRKAFVHITKDLPDVIRIERRSGVNRWASKNSPAQGNTD